MAVIPFYGAERPELFAIERRAMDRPGRVIGALDALLPAGGTVIDVGAGDGFTAEQLTTPERRIVAVEPAARMIRPERHLQWVRADAEHLPFRNATFDAAYATWAYYFSRGWDPSPGLQELHRVVRCGGPLIIADNLGGDEFTALAGDDISADPQFWEARGFRCQVVDTCFAFADRSEARRLLGFYFGEAAAAEAQQQLSFRVALFVGTGRGVT